MQSRAARGFLVALSLAIPSALLAAAAPASGEEESLATLQLRGGYDANPTGLPGRGEGSAFIAAGGAVAIGRDYAGGRLAFAAEGQHTEFAAPGIAPTDRVKFALETGHDLDTGWTLRTGMHADNVTSYDTRALNVAGVVKLRPADGAFRPFVTAEIRYAALNENNILYADFLPEPLTFVRGTLIPGVAIVHGQLEFGVSVSVSLTRYIRTEDPLGLDRDNIRIQPFVFATYKDDTLDISASLSRFDGRWDDRDLEDIQQTLYDLSLAKTFGDFKLDLAARRTVEDTTFPYVPVTLVSSLGAGLSYRLTPQLTLRTAAKTLRTDYPGAGLSSNVASFGGGASYEFGDGWTLGLDAAYQRGKLIDGEPMTGGVVSVSLARKFQLARRAPDEKR